MENADMSIKVVKHQTMKTNYENTSMLDIVLDRVLVALPNLPRSSSADFSLGPNPFRSIASARYRVRLTGCSYSNCQQ